MSKAKDAAVEARVLLDCDICGKRYRVNDVFTGSAQDVETAAKDGKVDPSPAAVAYVKEHFPPAPEEPPAEEAEG